MTSYWGGGHESKQSFENNDSEETTFLRQSLLLRETPGKTFLYSECVIISRDSIESFSLSFINF